MQSALAGAFVLLSIGILMAYAMEGHWPRGRRLPVIKDIRPLMRTPPARDRKHDAARAKWAARTGYKLLLRAGGSRR
jgi:hypothetical protein